MPVCWGCLLRSGATCLFTYAWYDVCMCGRYSIAVEPSVLEKRFGARLALPSGTGVSDVLRPRYNAAPSQPLPVILNADLRHIVLSHWGIPLRWESSLSA